MLSMRVVTCIFLVNEYLHSGGDKREAKEGSRPDYYKFRKGIIKNEEAVASYIYSDYRMRVTF